MKKNQLISVVMPCFKMGRFIGEALASVGNQTHTEWELIAVDDCGPDDGTKDAIEAFQKEFSEKKIFYKRLVNNQGVSAARNIGVESSNGSVIAFLDPDDLWKENHLSESISILINNEDVDVTACPVEIFKESEITTSVLWQISLWQRECFPMSLAAYCFIQPSATLIRKSAFLEVSGFCIDEELQHIEDWDLWIRLVEKRKKFRILDSSTCYYRSHVSQATADTVRNIALHDALATRHRGFFMQSQGYLISRLLDRSYHDYDRNSGPILRILFFLNKICKKLNENVKAIFRSSL